MGTLLFFGGLRAAAGGAPTLFLPLVVEPFLGNVLGLLSALDAFCTTFWLLLGNITTEVTDDGSLLFSNDFDFEKVLRSALITCTCGNICDEDDGSLPTYIVSKHNKTTHQTHEVSGEFVIWCDCCDSYISGSTGVCIALSNLCSALVPLTMTILFFKQMPT
jgi:hypothetical protein